MTPAKAQTRNNKISTLWVSRHVLDMLRCNLLLIVIHRCGSDDNRGNARRPLADVALELVGFDFVDEQLVYFCSTLERDNQ